MDKVLKNFVGIDVSKLFFDVAILKAGQSSKQLHHQFKQSLSGYTEMKAWLIEHDVYLDQETLFCMEYTGIYNTGLIDFLYHQKALLWVEMATRIKKSEGLERGSNDKTDAIKIARYAFRYHDRKQLWSPTEDSLNEIKNLITQRDRIVGSITRLTVPINELKEIGCTAQAKGLEKLQKTAIKHLQNAQQKIETEIVKIISKDKELSHKVAKVISIKGIGKVTAVAFLVYTKGFTSFETAKELACYCGVVPFIKKQSGISIKSTPRVSHFANKKLKCLLTMCALSASQYDKDLKAYYERKIAEGKHKRSVINAVRNKLVLRMFAVLRDNRDFVENYQRKCA